MIPSDFFHKLLQDKTETSRTMVQDIETCIQNQKAFEGLLKKLEGGEQVDFQKVMKAFTKSHKKTNDVLVRLSGLCMLMIHSDLFDNKSSIPNFKNSPSKEDLFEDFLSKLGRG